MAELELLAFDLKETFFVRLDNEVGSKAYNSIMCRNEAGELVDPCENGRKSCAVFVGSFLRAMSNRRVKFISESHGLVTQIEKDLIKSGWKRRRASSGVFVNLQPGDILVWEKKKILDNKNEHIGIFQSWATRLAVSTNAYDEGRVYQHHYTYDRTRRIERVYFHLALQ